MSGGVATTRRIARRLTAFAADVLPRQRADWARAMVNELEYVPDDLAALTWAVGCLLTSFTARVVLMEIGTLRTARYSRIALGFWLLLCFWSVTKFLIGLPVSMASGTWPHGWPGSYGQSLFLLSTCAIGPLGLILAFRFVVLERRALSRAAMAAICLIAAWAFIGNTLHSVHAAGPGYGLLRAIVVSAALPLIGAIHLLYLAETTNRSNRSATSAADAQGGLSANAGRSP